MWPDLEEQIAVEQAEIRELVAFHRELLDLCRIRAPAGIELTASGAFLHALYSGVENICRRIAIELDGEIPRGGDWHRRLLRLMTESTQARTNEGSHVGSRKCRRGALHRAWEVRQSNE